MEGSAANGAQPSAVGTVPGLGTVAAASCQGVQSTGPRVLRRLARFEYDNSIQDLLGQDANADEGLAADTVVNGFDDNAQALVVTPLLGDQLYTSAERLAAQAVQDLARLAPCATANATDDCATQIITDFGRRAFRRPLTDTEAARYLGLHQIGAKDGGFSAGIQLVLTAMLQSPGFLYRTELGDLSADGSFVLDPYEIATELAYTLTGSTPDDVLLDAAKNNALATPDQLDAQAHRLIASARGQAQLVHFVSEWLELDRLASVPKDAAIFPEFAPEIRQAMAKEAQRFVARVAFEGEGTLAALLTAPLAFVDDGLASFYGVPKPSMPDADGFGAVQAPDPERHGVLALGGVLTTFARPDSTSPVLRGKLVRERVLCQPLQPPPPGIIVQPPPVDPTLSVRQRYAAHSAKQPCQSCHRLIDPIGFAFEHFDGVGRYRELDGDHPVDASGQIVDSVSTDAHFDNAAQLTQILGASDEVARCFALQWFRFACGVAENADLSCALEQVQQSFQQSGGKLSELLLSTVRLAHFVRRTAAPGDAAATSAAPEPAPASTPVAEAQDAGAPTGMAAAQTGLVVTVHIDSSWAAGHCDSVSVRNDSGAAVDWSTQLMIDGTLNDHWNSTADGQSGLVTFTGADWNRTLKPGETAQFGYCAQTTS
jgi:hypothetical protein